MNITITITLDAESLRNFTAALIVARYAQPLMLPGSSTGGLTRESQLSNWTADAYAIADRLIAEGQRTAHPETPPPL